MRIVSIFKSRIFNYSTKTFQRCDPSDAPELLATWIICVALMFRLTVTFFWLLPHPQPKNKIYFQINSHCALRSVINDTQPELDSLTTNDETVPAKKPHETNAQQHISEPYDESIQLSTPYNANQQPLVSSMAKHKSNAIKIQIQGSQSNLNGHTNYRRHISFDDSCKKEDGDEVRNITIYHNKADHIYRFALWWLFLNIFCTLRSALFSITLSFNASILLQ